MAMSAHLAELAEKHRVLDQRIEEAIASPGVDDAQIRRLKQEKLKLKDEMERLSKGATRH
ncbi:MAG: YdcH family protein [Hyphomicrobium sp.]